MGIKVGDMVMALVSDCAVTLGREYEVVEVYSDGGVDVIDDIGGSWWLFDSEYESTNTPSTKTVVQSLLNLLKGHNIAIDSETEAQAKKIAGWTE